VSSHCLPKAYDHASLLLITAKGFAVDVRLAIFAAIRHALNAEAVGVNHKETRASKL
jgi:hypothetical protein